MLSPPLLIALLETVSPPQLAAWKVKVPPVVDGRLDDAAWRDAPPTDHFTQQTPNDGAAPSERTVVRVVYDTQALYIAAECEHKNTPIMRRLTRRDRDSESEWVGVFLDTTGDGRDAFYFAVNVEGVLLDGTVHNQNVISMDWDENWEARSTVGPQGWTAEIKIPFRILRFGSGIPVRSWGLQIARYISARQEFDQWSHVPRDNPNWVANYGRLDDLQAVEGKAGIELRPFVLGRVRKQDAGPDTLAHDYQGSATAGMDVKLHLTESLKLTAALNPDFAQVEADQLILNLTNYETFLPEKRALFVEGADAFSTPMQEQLLFGAVDQFPNRIFYSRRIGRSLLAPTLAPNEVLVELPDPSIIYGATKLEGTIGSRWSVGAISAFTGKNELKLQDPSTGMRSSRLVDPASLFNVLRIKRSLGDQAHLGLIGTGVSRFDRAALHDAYVAGVDALWRSPTGDYVLAGQVTGSLIENGPARTMQDGTQIGSGARGGGLWLRAAREGGKHFIWMAQYTGASLRHDYNDVGYMARQNLHEGRATVAYRSFDPGAYVLESYTALTAVARRSLTGLDLGDTYEATSRLRLTSFWTVTGTATGAPARFDDREIGDGTALERPGWLGAKLEIATDPRRDVVATVAGQGAWLSGGGNATAQVGLLVHVLPQLDFELDPQATYSTGEYRYAPNAVTAGGPLLFGRLLARSLGATLRAQYTFTPRLSLQAYAQLFLAAGHYTDLRGAAAMPEVRLADLAGAPAAMPGANPDFQQAALNVNLVLRWEYLLGSVAYLVYSRSQLPDVELSLMQNAALASGALRNNAAVDVVLLKVMFWWSS